MFPSSDLKAFFRNESEYEPGKQKIDWLCHRPDDVRRVRDVYGTEVADHIGSGGRVDLV